MVTASELLANGEGRLYRLPDGRLLMAELSYMGLKHFFSVLAVQRRLFRRGPGPSLES